MKSGNILILDTETTGLNPNPDKCIEVAAILFNVEYRQMVQSITTLLPCDANPVEHINGIRPDLTRTQYSPQNVIVALEGMAMNCDAIVAHNAQFDHKFMKIVPGLGDAFWTKPWVCTRNDFKWPSKPVRLRLQDICESLDIPYVDAHRALADCSLLANCLAKVDNLAEQITNIINFKN